MKPRRAIPPPAGCQPAKQRTTSPRYRPDATRYGVAPIVNRLLRGRMPALRPSTNNSRMRPNRKVGRTVFFLE